MDTLTVLMWINFFASLILSGSFGVFLIFLFGRTNSPVYAMSPFKCFMLKFALALCVSGALLNALTFSNPPWTEIMLNSGLALLFSWAAHFHYHRFVVPWKKEMHQQAKPRKLAGRTKSKKNKVVLK